MKISLGSGAGGEGAQCVHERIVVKNGRHFVAVCEVAAEVMDGAGFVKIDHTPECGWIKGMEWRKDLREGVR